MVLVVLVEVLVVLVNQVDPEVTVLEAEVVQEEAVAQEVVLEEVVALADMVVLADMAVLEDQADMVVDQEIPVNPADLVVMVEVTLEAVVQVVLED